MQKFSSEVCVVEDGGICIDIDDESDLAKYNSYLELNFTHNEGQPVMINLTINETARKNNIRRCKEKSIAIPTFAQMKNPESISSKTREELKKIGLWDVNPLNLFRITWKNDPKEIGGGYGGVNYIELAACVDGRSCKNHCPGRQVVPDRCA